MGTVAGLARSGNRLLDAYRGTGADLPFGDLLSPHGVGMEGYFWRFTDAASGRVAIALMGVNQPSDGGPAWATIGVANGPDGTLAYDAVTPARAGGRGVEVHCDGFTGTETSVRVRIGEMSLDADITHPRQWRGHPFGGSSVFQTIPKLNQYWHPWLLGGRATGVVNGPQGSWSFTDAQVYGEKNWGRAGFPDQWWWGQAQGFADPDACVAFAGGPVKAGPLGVTVTGLVVALPDGTILRLGNPGTSPVHAQVHDDTWQLRGRSARWEVDVLGHAPLREALILPVPLVDERRNTPGALEHLTGDMSVIVRRRGRATPVWQGHSRLAALEHGGLGRAATEQARRCSPPGVG